MRTSFILATALLTLLAACEAEPPPPTGAAAPPHMAGMPGQRGLQPPGGFQVPPPPTGSGSGATGLTWTAPASWAVQPPSNPMRKAQFKVPGTAGDGLCVVFYFGPGQGGPPRANAERWANQFQQADGRTGAQAMKTADRKVAGMNVLTVEVTGAYSGGPMMGGPKPPPQPGHMLLGSVVEGPDANWFFKLTGPQKTVEENRAAFASLIDSVKPGS